MPPNEAVTLPAPKIDAVALASNKWKREYQAFQQQLPDLLDTHRGQYVVIHNGQVVDSGPDDVALALRFFAQHGNVPVHIGRVSTEPEPVQRVPHYRERRVSEGSS